MTETAKKKRLLAMQSPVELYEVIGEYDPDSTAEVFMRRRRDGGWSEKTNPWEAFDVETEGFNTSIYVYETQTGPRLRLKGKTVETYDESGSFLDNRPVEYARTLCETARRWRKAKKDRILFVHTGDGDAKIFIKEPDLNTMVDEETYDIVIQANGDVRVGCQLFPWEDIDTFAKKNGWWK